MALTFQHTLLKEMSIETRINLVHIINQHFTYQIYLKTLVHRKSWYGHNILEQINIR